MIVSASRRTNIPAYFGEWFIRRIREGYCEVANPFNNTQIRCVDLSPEVVDCIVFWTRHSKSLYPEAIADAAGFNVEFRNTAWDGIFAGLAAREYDAVISSVTITEERQENMDFSDPYVNAGQVLVVPIDLDGVETLSDMEGMTVGAQIGTTGAIAVQDVDGVELASFDEVGLAFEDLAAGRIDGVVADAPVAANYALQNESYAETLTIVGEPFTDEFFGVAFPQGSDELREAVNEGLAQVEADGTLDELKDQWLR